jgi:invasion protein IalB
MLHMFKIAAALGILGAAFFSSALYAAEPTAADRAWIDTCMSQRKSSNEAPARLRKYCVCMQQIVEDNQPFENVTALERTFPPAHQMCWNDAGRR